MADRDANDSELLILEILRDQGFTADKIPESNEGRTPDLFAEDPVGLRYLIEVRDKFPSDGEVEERQTAFDADGVFTKTESHDSENRYFGIVDDKVDQLTSPLAPEADLRLVCLVSVVRDGEYRTARMRSTLCGERLLVDLDTGITTPCFYFGHSSFYTHREVLDGGLTVDAKGVSLIVNSPYSPNADLLRQSALARVLAGGVCDPAELEARGLAFLADTPLPRGRQAEGQVLRYVQQKHGVPRLSPMRRRSFVGEALVRRNA